MLFLITEQHRSAYYFCKASATLKNDKDVVLAVLAAPNCAHCFEHASDALKNDKDVVMTLIANWNSKSISDFFRWLMCAGGDAKGDPAIVLATIKLDVTRAMEFASSDAKADKTVMLAAAEQDGRTLAHASDELKNDKEVVAAAVHQSPRAIEFASAQCKADKELIVGLVKIDGLALQHASDALKNDKAVVHAAFRQNLEALKHTALMDNDGDFVCSLIKEDLAAVRYALDLLATDKTVLECARLALIKAFDHDKGRGAAGAESPYGDAGFLETWFVIGRVNSDLGIVHENDAVYEDYDDAHGRQELKDADAARETWTALLADLGVAAAAKRAVMAAWSASSFSEIEEVPAEAIKMMQPQYLRVDKEIALLGIRQSSFDSSSYIDSYMAVLPVELLADRDFVLAASKVQPSFLAWVLMRSDEDEDEEEEEDEESNEEKDADTAPKEPTQLGAAQEAFKKDKDLVMAVLLADDSGWTRVSVLPVVSDALKSDRDVVLAAIKQSGKMCSFSLESASIELQNDKDLVLAAVEQNIDAFFDVYINQSEECKEVAKSKDFLIRCTKANWRMITGMLDRIECESDIYTQSTVDACLLALYPANDLAAIVEAAKEKYAADVATVVQRWEQHELKKAALAAKESAAESSGPDLDKLKEEMAAAKKAKDYKKAKALKAEIAAAESGSGDGGGGDAAAGEDEGADDESEKKEWERSVYKYGYVAERAAWQLKEQARTIRDENQHQQCIPHLAAAFTRKEEDCAELDDFDAAEACNEAATTAAELKEKFDELFPNKFAAIWGPFQEQEVVEEEEDEEEDA